VLSLQSSDIRLTEDSSIMILRNVDSHYSDHTASHRAILQSLNVVYLENMRSKIVFHVFIVVLFCFIVVLLCFIVVLCFVLL
jgi:ABC-type multidrug transport system permease subunit